jgi:hypothetical protein
MLHGQGHNQHEGFSIKRFFRALFFAHHELNPGFYLAYTKVLVPKEFERQEFGRPHVMVAKYS